jgi:hypothetical protein
VKAKEKHLISQLELLDLDLIVVSSFVLSLLAWHCGKPFPSTPQVWQSKFFLSVPAALRSMFHFLMAEKPLCLSSTGR